MTRRTILAGIDEAGLGPLLGPLAIGYSVFRVEDGSHDLWKVLESCVSKDPRVCKGRLAVADSKLVFRRNEASRIQLELTALSFLALAHPERRPPPDGRTLVFDTPSELADGAQAIAEEPWHPWLSARLPAAVSQGELSHWIERLRGGLQNAGIEILDAGVLLLPAAALNRSFAQTGNKSTTVWNCVSQVLQRLWRLHAGTDAVQEDAGMRMVVDRQGGRFRYRGLLARAFPEARVDALGESPARSEYEIDERAPRRPSQDCDLFSAVPPPATDAKRPPRSMHLAFAERAESLSFPVALASCIAKYARETCMTAFNACFRDMAPALRPTAGYVSDGRRWLKEAKPVLAQAGIDLGVLVRRR